MNGIIAFLRNYGLDVRSAPLALFIAAVLIALPGGLVILGILAVASRKYTLNPSSEATHGQEEV